MTKTIYYEKKGRRYVPVAEYDSDFMDSYTKGNHLVMCYPGGSSRRFNIDPNYAAMIAAGRVAEDAISKAVVAASEMRPHNKPITEKQKKAWAALAKTFDSDRYYIEIPSAREVAEAGVKAMIAEADQLMQHESVRKAYEHFQLMCKLVKENDDIKSQN
jgi:hypothetical protein|tara:strand:- start:541 stop:1017 length:477 start_codon:yes stop_codon:yes gene_type:complete